MSWVPHWVQNFFAAGVEVELEEEEDSSDSTFPFQNLIEQLLVMLFSPNVFLRSNSIRCPDASTASNCSWRIGIGGPPRGSGLPLKCYNETFCCSERVPGYTFLKLYMSIWTELVVDIGILKVALTVVRIARSETSTLESMFLCDHKVPLQPKDQNRHLTGYFVRVKLLPHCCFCIVKKLFCM